MHFLIEVDKLNPNENWQHFNQNFNLFHSSRELNENVD